MLQSHPCGRGLQGLAIALALIATAWLGVTARAVAGQPASPRPEARGLWVVRDSLRSRTGVEVAVLAAKALQMNFLLVQVNGDGTAFYDSQLIPRSDEVAPGFDALAYAIELGHQAGLEVHAWINAFTVGFLHIPPLSPQHVVRQHPEWVLFDERGRSLLSYARNESPDDLPAMMLDPGVPAVQSYVHDVVMEVVRRYDVDGIHLDYIRYPSHRYGYNPLARAAFQASAGFDPLALQDPAAFRTRYPGIDLNRARVQWDDWRRQQVTGLVRRLAQSIQAEKPWVKLSAAVFANQTDAVRYRFQDWPSWLRQGLLDFVAPMAYSEQTETVRQQIAAAVAVRGNRQVYAGLGAYRLVDDLPELLAKIEVVRSLGADGIVLFSSKSVVQELPVLRTLRERAFAEPTSIPAMPWKGPRAANAASRAGRP